MATQDLLWWWTNLQSWNGHTWIPRATDMDIYTDASNDGWGIIIDSTTWAGKWSAAQQGLHINHKELLTVLFTVKLPICQGHMLNIISNNMTTLTYINHFGGTWSAALMEMVTHLWKHCIVKGMQIQTTYVPSAFNPVDAPSWQLMSQLEWSISSSFFTLLNNKWGPHHIDLFATKRNMKLQQFMTWKHCPFAVATDALSQRWQSLGNVYCCPPWNLLLAVLQKIEMEQLTATVITPFWTSALWFPTIQRMAIAPPLPIPHQEVLPPPGGAPNIVLKNPHWSLSTWWVSSAI